MEYRENAATPRQRHHSASGTHTPVCGFGQPPVELSTTISISLDGAEVLVVRELNGRETGEALRVFRQLFPKSEGYVYVVNSKAAAESEGAA